MKEQLYGFLDISLFAKAEANKDKEMRMLDWEKVATIIKERKPNLVVAGLKNDWAYTSTILFEDGEVKTDINRGYLGSVWAIPAIILDDKEEIECWKYKSESLTSDPREMWPQRALDILKEK